jgi:hypothetical protein
LFEPDSTPEPPQPTIKSAVRISAAMRHTFRVGIGVDKGFVNMDNSKFFFFVNAVLAAIAFGFSFWQIGKMLIIDMSSPSNTAFRKTGWCRFVQKR